MCIRRWSPLVALGLVTLLVAGCGTPAPSGTTGIPTSAPTVVATLAPPQTLAPTAAATASTGDPFAGKPYALDLPAGWEPFDLADPAGKAALDAFVAANPEMGAAIAAFQLLPNTVFAVNRLTGNVLIAFATPSGGLPLDSIAASFTAQFAAVPGVVSPPQPEDVTLPIGPAVHWNIELAASGTGGDDLAVHESLYLVVNDDTAVAVEFVAVEGAAVPEEDTIIQSLRFQP